MTFDSGRKECLLHAEFYGISGRGSWTFLERNGTWTNASPLTSPQGYVTGMVFDSQRNTTVLVAGGLTRLADTWEWTGTDWRQATSPIRPPFTGGGTLDFDSRRGRIVYFGGNTGYVLTNDVWELAGGVIWQRIAVPGPRPEPRLMAAHAYDSIHGVTLVFGGGGVGPRDLGDFWAWDGSRWAQIGDSPSPPPRLGALSWFDSRRGKFVIHGGLSRSRGVLTDTWEWNGRGWEEAICIGTLLERGAAATAYDPRTGVLRLIGGDGGMTSGPMADIWELRPLWDEVGSGHTNLNLRVPLELEGRPVLGETMALTFENEVGIGAVAIAPGTSRLPPPVIPFAGACASALIYPDLALATWLPVSGNPARVRLPIPDLPALRDLPFTAQGLTYRRAGCTAATTGAAGIISTR